MLSAEEQRVLAAVQRLPLTERPFAAIGADLGMDEAAVLAICKKLQRDGVIRRFGPALSHRRAGFTANLMTVLRVPEDALDSVGQRLAADVRVTHCYARSGWDYNLFFMIHSTDREECRAKATSLISAVDPAGTLPHRFFFSIRELKKTSFEVNGDEDGGEQ